MDKLLAHIDIAQEDGTQNPAAAHSRIKAKTNGSVVLRSPAGVESPIGGLVQVVGTALSADVVIPTKVLTEITQLSVTIPPGKSAVVNGFVFSRFVASAATAVTFQTILRVKNPAGANAAVTGSFNTRTAATAAATAGDFYLGGSFSVAENANFDGATFSSSQTRTANNFSGTVSQIVLRNNSTNTNATVIAVINPATANDVAMIGASIFAIIS